MKESKCAETGEDQRIAARPCLADSKPRVALLLQVRLSRWRTHTKSVCTNPGNVGNLNKIEKKCNKEKKVMETPRFPNSKYHNHFYILMRCFLNC